MTSGTVSFAAGAICGENVCCDVGCTVVKKDLPKEGSEIIEIDVEVGLSGRHCGAARNLRKQFSRRRETLFS